MKTRPLARALAGGLGAAALLLTGCAADAGSDPAASPAPESAERYASVLDDLVASLGEELPATSVTLGAETVDFAEGEELSIAFNGYGKGFDYSAPEFTAADDMAAEHGITIDQFDPAGDPQVQVTQVQDAIASGKYNAMVVYPLSTDLMCDVMTRQMPEAGIVPVAVGNPPCTTEDRPGLLTVVPDTGGTDYVFPAWAENIAQREEGGKAVLITGPELDYTSILATEALEATLPRYDVELLAVQRTDFTQADSLQKAQDLLQSFPDATVFVSAYPEGTHAAVTATKMAGRQDDIHVYDFGGESRSLAEIGEGLVAGSTPFYPYTKVKTAIQALLLARAGEPVDPLIPYSGHAEESLRGQDDRVMFITPDNVERFSELLAEY